MEKYFETQMNKATHIKCELYYEKGGYGQVRGLHLSVMPVERKRFDSNGYEFISERYIGRTGISMMIAPISRKSDKKISEYWSKIEPLLDEVVQLFEKNDVDEICKLMTL